MIESSVLKVTKVKFSSLIWKIRHFKKQFLVSVSPIAKTIPQKTMKMRRRRENIKIVKLWRRK